MLKRILSRTNCGERSDAPPAAPRRLRTLLVRSAGFGLAIAVAGALLLCYVVIVLYPQLPSVDMLTAFQPTVPLRVYTADDVLIARYGIERRIPLTLDRIPAVMQHAVLATEDARFYDHHGVDFVGLARAALADLTRGGREQGASTITMQLARNFFLSRDKTFMRKIDEILLAIRIESQLTKQQILQLYLNQIYLGERSYGFGAAAKTYFGIDLANVTAAQAALLAGLPKAPSAYDPIGHPERARSRQLLILGRMHDLHYLDDADYQAALSVPPYAGPPPRDEPVHADYVGEMVRRMMVDRYREAAYERGFQVWTTVRAAEQRSAYAAVQAGVADYDHRHAYAGPEGYAAAGPSGAADALRARPAVAGLVAAVVLSAGERRVVAQTRDGREVVIAGHGLDFARSRTRSRSLVAAGLRPGAIVRIATDAAGHASIDQLPSVEAALVSLDPRDGAVRALVGGFSLTQNKFNHVTQGWRQPGSSFKPFLYSAALEKGLAPATVVDDAPFELAPAGRGARAWRPKEDGALLGPITLRVGLQKSKNLVAVRVLDAIGPDYVKQYVVARFGFSADRIVANLPMALGAGSVTPLQMAAAYAVFANGGFLVQPYLVDRIRDGGGELVFQARPTAAGRGAPRTISAANSFIMTSLLQSVAQHGTGAATNALHRTDVAGKTGSTNAYHDGWFAGFAPSRVAVAWMGFDAPRSLGPREYGAHTALPIWLRYMQDALQSVPVATPAPPADVATIDGELYETAHVPGNGFVPAIGATPPDLADTAMPRGTSPPPAPAPASAAAISADERARILGYFDSP
ncbi:penicillin-binding protein 1A [Burkholderia ubonensis]|uniref:penicillin-binding protein 1A n=1 Tax=Burkholderia ubonensis TaxID=101571 RepID=UPI000BA5908D|nr:PBP1A family penicillin-binding protein [Burkholderia ubonensis]PAK14208.1 penicillin-binding protein [Burkholderia ubonensis]RQP32748.1 PBP1A family penicillin-binding protein [Burkholderia ubonensis]RQP39327.1 PBP1A family penicillin-binding protein [Burkholderia ubonensis]RQP44855.1 PBP1A family penicillin-binding protein [Burkholderia ubonensis]RQP58565.1 PBP1A family penicillin-binding protein [Burkholderia ubonensis]